MDLNRMHLRWRTALVLLAVAMPPAIARRALAQDTTRLGAKKNAKGGKSAADSATGKKKTDHDSSGGLEKLAERKREAERLPLFATNDVLPFTLVANFKALSKERDTLSKHHFAGTLIVGGSGGKMDSIPVTLRSRGHYRLAKCGFVPLRVVFSKATVKGTVFEGEQSLKLGAHCQNGNREFEQVVLREHLAYRIFNLVTPNSYRSRLSQAAYVDSATGKPVDSRYALWIESDDHMAARVGGTLREIRQAMFDDVDQTSLLRMTVLEYLISNHDWSIYALHNVRMVRLPGGELHPIPYDFDFSGLVNARYAVPPPQLNLRSVRERMNRGPCVSAEILAPVLAEFRARKEKILALPMSIPGYDGSNARDAEDFLAQFFRTIDRPGDLKAELIDSCNRKGAA